MSTTESGSDRKGATSRCVNCTAKTETNLSCSKCEKKLCFRCAAELHKRFKSQAPSNKSATALCCDPCGTKMQKDNLERETRSNRSSSNNRTLYTVASMGGLMIAYDSRLCVLVPFLLMWMFSNGIFDDEEDLDDEELDRLQAAKLARQKDPMQLKSGAKTTGKQQEGGSKKKR
eukprot:gb/GEZN01015168.1/.p1 GENE.gb/GEZN01015168.1/~~gb/GEZN01015168.1/.p1  ORF type:complete len:174 (+),score=28.93 gb/GEZN01015168.1/:54-575(+)